MRALLIPLLLLVAAACKKEKATEAGPPPTPSMDSAAPRASTLPSSTAGPAPEAPVIYGEHTLPAGKATDGGWTASFKIQEQAGGRGLAWITALGHCARSGQSLCTETQWLRACLADAELGKNESWTLTAELPGAVVRGGPEGCATRKLAKVDEREERRSALCCDRAVAIRTDDQNPSLLFATSKKLLEYETALREKKVEALRAAYDDRVSYLGQELGRDALLTKLSDSNGPDKSWYFDQCTLTVQVEDQWPSEQADCKIVQPGDATFVGKVQRLVFGGSTGKLRYVGDPGGPRKREQKERVESFLPSSR